MIYTPKIEEAIRIASTAHKGQERRANNIPYIVHPMSVAVVLSRLGQDEDVIAAGILHDVVEDTSVKLDEIRERFGDRVADLVNDVTEPDRSVPWEERKRIQIEHIKDTPREGLLVKSADTLCNMRDMLSEYRRIGDAAFRVFTMPKDRTLQNLSERVNELGRVWPENPLLPELRESLAELLG